MTHRVVYIVDDDEAVRRSIAFLLDTVAFDHRSFDSGKAFLAAADLPAGCLLLDVLMPGLNGLDVMRRLGAIGRKMPVVLMTAANSYAVMRTAVNIGPYLLLEKPFDDDALLNVIETAFDSGARREPCDRVRCAMDAVARLTEVQSLVLRAEIAGMSAPQVAKCLQVDDLSLQRMRISVKAALGARDVHHAIEIGMTAGLQPLLGR